MSLATVERRAPRSLRKPNPRAVSPKLAQAIRAVIHDGIDFPEAAQSAGLTTRHLRDSLARPHVRKFVHDEQQVRLTSVRLDSISDLARIKKGDGAAAVSAIRALEEMAAPDANHAATNAATTPGVTINIVSNQAIADQGQHVQPLTIEHEPRQSLVDEPSRKPAEPAQKKAGGKNRRKPARS